MRRARRWFATLLLLVAIAVVILLFQMRPPEWWTPEDSLSPERTQLSERFEQASVSELHRVRTTSRPWAVRVRESEVNAWLDARLPLWLEHIGAEPLGDVRVHFLPGAVEIGVTLEDVPGVAVITLRPEVTQDTLRPGLGPLRIGRLPVPFATDAAIGGMLAALDNADASEEVKALLPLLRSRDVPSKFELMDGRIVRLRDLEMREGELILEFETLPRRK
ncbi:MAG: hypothetical protein SGJ11_18605 [Phycisphaerae bacterium]|nr:hypothetical protein [Phycisphaerae bacterium]